MPNEVIVEEMPETGGRVKLSCGNNHAQISKRLDRMAFDEILDHLLELNYKWGKLKGREVSEDLPGYEAEIADIKNLYGYIRQNYLYRFLKHQ